MQYKKTSGTLWTGGGRISTLGSEDGCSRDPACDKRILPVENRFKDALESDQGESGEGESMDEILSEAGEEMELGITSEEGALAGNFSPSTTHELLQDLSGDDWADTATPPLGSPRKNLDLPLASEPSNMGMMLLRRTPSRGVGVCS